MMIASSRLIWVIRMLKVNDLIVRYGVIEAIKGISFEVNDGEIATLIGANGAGKTTTMHTISGLLKPYSGSIFLDDKEISKVAPHKIVEMGIAQCPERRRVFAQQSVEDNLLLGAYTRKDKDEINKDLNNVYDLFPRLLERKNQLAGTLSGGEQQMLAVARGLMSEPKIILLDEPSMGLAPLIVNQIYDLITEIRDSGITVLLVEQNAKKALSICDYAYVLENGVIKLEGTGNELSSNEDVKKAYLGG